MEPNMSPSHAYNQCAAFFDPLPIILPGIYPHDFNPQIELPVVKVPKKRGRKPKFPHYPNKKSEDFDKYWIRRFRNYVRKNCSEKPFSSGREFWIWFASQKSVPGHPLCNFKSHSTQYRQNLLKEQEFVQQISGWFIQYGREEVVKRYRSQPAKSLVYVQYFEKEYLASQLNN